jgi:rubredoxin
MVHENRRTIMDKYVCAICGHEYNPEKGEPLQDIPAGIAFENLPDSWACPVCGAKKHLFVKV